jgi:flagellar biosynthesis/type III secretory pathway protein FliH
MAIRPLSTLLDRFRRGVAVPAAVGDELAAELAPVFASLELFEAEAEEVRRAYARQAEARLAAGRERAARISAGRREAAEAERARAAEECWTRAREEASAVEAAGRAEADRIRERASERIPNLVAEVVACVARGLP